jgi:hypothetical protein
VINQPVTNANRGPVDIGAIELGAARVLDVIISESTYNLAQHVFSFSDGTYQGQPMTGSGNQLRTVPVGGADTVSIRFSDDMATSGAGALGSGSLTLTGLAFQSVLNPSGFSYDSNTQTAKWTFDDPLPANQYLISLATAANDAGGNAVDGEWTNPFSVFTTNAMVSTFPSGDGLAGGQFNFVMTILPGDHDRDNDVDGISFLLWQQMIGGPGHTFQQGDFNGDGYTDGDDLAILNANYGIQLLNLVFADFNNDDDVDGDDLAIWSANNGATDTTHECGDANGDGNVDGADWLIWQRQVGLSITWVM